MAPHLCWLHWFDLSIKYFTGPMKNKCVPLMTERSSWIKFTINYFCLRSPNFTLQGLCTRCRFSLYYYVCGDTVQCWFFCSMSFCWGNPIKYQAHLVQAVHPSMRQTGGCSMDWWGTTSFQTIPVPQILWAHNNWPNRVTANKSHIFDSNVSFASLVWIHQKHKGTMH